MILLGFKYIFAFIIFIGAGLFIFDSILLPIYVGYDNEHYVPDLRGEKRSDAVETLQSLGYHIELITRPFEPKVKPNTVLNISPRQFTKVKEGRTIKMTVAGVRKHVKVPDVIGESVRNATFDIQRNELIVDTVFNEFNTEFRKGYVISQLPEAGNLRLAGYGVTLIVSDGNPPDYFLVPDLINLDQDKAKQKIVDYGFNVGEITLEFQPHLLEGTIIEQSLTPGMKLTFPARIDIRISIENEIIDTLEGNL